MLTPRQIEILRTMAAAEAAEDYENAELVCERGSCYLGTERISPRTVTALLRLCLVKLNGDLDGYHYFTINEEGRHMAKDPSYIPQIIQLFRVP